MQVPADLRYSEEHEWVRLADGVATIGITDYAQEELGDIVFVELPAVGAKLEKDGRLGVVESVKAVSDLYAPVSGEVAEVNDALREKPELVNADPFGDGWLMRVELGAPDEVEQLMDAAAYQAQTAG